ncbi:cytochrome P450 [Ramicandelaber brevisporus]|nr:cytochrome P450 [Ramicandelaber brevisporus]
MAVAVCFALAVLYLVLTTLYNIFLHPLSKLPGPWYAGAIPGAGEFHSSRKTLPFELTALHEKYGPIVRLSSNFVTIADPPTSRLIHSTHTFRKAPLYRSFDYPGESTFSTTDPEFSKKRKRLIGPVFGALNIAQMEPLIHQVGPQMIVNRIKAHHRRTVSSRQDKAVFVEVDLYSTFYEMTFNVIGRLAFGETFEISKEDTDIGSVRAVQLLKSIDSGLIMKYVIPEFLHRPLRDILRFKPFLLLKELEEYAAKCISDKLQLSVHVVDDASPDEKSSPMPSTSALAPVPTSESAPAPESTATPASGTKDILQLMIESVDPETGERLSFGDLQSEAISCLVAGTDTTSNTMTWVFDQLFQHPSVLAEVEAEVLAAFPDPSERISYRDAKSKLPYLDAVITEAMRVRSIVGGLLPRVVPKGGRIMHGYNVPEGTVVGTSPHVMHTYSQLWKEPFKFWPERFIVGVSGATAEDVARRRQNVTPFGIGVRSCIGRQLAIVEYTVGIATLIQQFEIRPATVPYKPLEPQFVFVVSPASKMLLAKIRPRFSA